MGWHEFLMDRLEPILRGEHITPPSQPFLMLDGGTPNFRAMAWSTEYLRVTRFPDELPTFVKPADKQTYIDSWRAKCKTFFEDQKRRGFMTIGTGGSEQLCADPHINFWMTAVVAMRRAAKEAKHQDVLDLTSWWFCSLLALFKAAMTPDGMPILPSARCKGTPGTEVGMLIVQILLKLPYQGPFKKQATWNDRFYTSAREVKKLVDEGDDLGGAAKATALPKLLFPMTIQKFQGGHLAFCDKTEDGFQLQEEFADWTLVEYGGFRKHKLTFDLSWKKPVPDLPKPLVKEMKTG